MSFPKELNKQNIDSFLGSFDNVMTDCDGVLWAGDDLITKSNDAINKLRYLGKKIFYVSNNSTKSRDDYVLKCEKLGFIAEKEEIISSSYVLAQHLKQQKFNKKVYVVGTKGLSDELDNVSIKHCGVGPDHVPENYFSLTQSMTLDSEVGAVAVGFDPYFSFPKIMRAVSHLRDTNCLFLATNTDEQFPVGNKNLVFPGTGGFVRCLETVSERKAKVMGKPHSEIFQVICKEHNLLPSRTLMIGDRCNTDILLGKNCGLHTLCVLTGVTSLNDLQSWSKIANDSEHPKVEYYAKMLPHYYIPKLADLCSLLEYY